MFSRRRSFFVNCNRIHLRSSEERSEVRTTGGISKPWMILMKKNEAQKRKSEAFWAQLHEAAWTAMLSPHTEISWQPLDWWIRYKCCCFTDRLFDKWAELLWWPRRFMEERWKPWDWRYCPNNLLFSHQKWPHLNQRSLKDEHCYKMTVWHVADGKQQLSPKVAMSLIMHDFKRKYNLKTPWNEKYIFKFESCVHALIVHVSHALSQI